MLMKNPFIYLALLLLIVIMGCNKKYYDGKDLVLKDGLLYKSSQKNPFTGKIKALINKQVLEYAVVNGMKNGEFIFRFENNNIQMKGNIVNNNNEGVWNYYFPDGTIESTGIFLNNNPDGTWRWFYPNGQIKEQGNFNAGKREGEWLSYKTDGTLYITREFKDGELLDSLLSN